VHPTEPKPILSVIGRLACDDRSTHSGDVWYCRYNSPFKGLHARRELTESTGAAWPTRDVLTEPRRAIDVFGALFARRSLPTSRMQQ